MKLTLLKHMDRLIGVPVIRLLSAPKNNFGASLRTILLIRPGGIGDAVLLMPAIAALKKAFPDSSIDVLAEGRNSSIFSLSPVIRGILRYDSPKEFLSVFRESYDLVVDSEQWHRLSAIVTRIVNARMSIGFETNERKKLFIESQPYSQDDYEVFNFLRLLNPVMKGNIRFDPEVPFLHIPSSLIEKARSVLCTISKKEIVAIFPGSSIRQRKWGRRRFHQTASLLSKQGYGIVVVGGKDDIRSGEEIIDRNLNSLNLCGKLSLPETAAVLNESSLLITGDSGIMHIGSGLGIKIVALFGPGREKKWAPRGKNCRVINKHLPCSPCTTFGYTLKCKKNAECMKSITVDEVVQKALELLEG